MPLWARAAAITLIVALCASVPAPSYAATLAPSTSWYESDTAELTITSTGGLIGLAQIVAGTAVDSEGVLIPQDDFTGKTVTVSAPIGFLNLLWWGDDERIGTAEHPFNGTFDGNNVQISSLSLGVYEDAHDVGLFGVTGEDSVIKNVELLGSCVIDVGLTANSTETVECVGSLVGMCNGAIENCTSAASVTVKSDVATTPGKYTIITDIGGLAGVCVGDVTGCGFIGQLGVSTPVDAQAHGLNAVITHVGGLAGVVGADGAAGTHGGDLTDSYNTGTISVETAGDCGLDEFGEPLASHSYAVGGLVGLCMGSIDNCYNDALIVAANGEGTGGIAGVVYSDGVQGGYVSDEHPAIASDRLVVSNCYNQNTRNNDPDAPDVIGLMGVGGIAGKSGSNTSITGCYNRGFIRATRWNKPSGAGIVGRTYGTSEISYCYNSGDIQNYFVSPDGTVWSGGYYMAGIVGVGGHVGGDCSEDFVDRGYNEITESIDSPVDPSAPEIWGCYNTGHVLTPGWDRPGGIIGENNGYVHSCYFLNGTVQPTPAGVYSPVGRDYGTIVDTGSLSSDILQSSAGVGLLNAPVCLTDWSLYYVIDRSVSVWPIFNTQSSMRDDERAKLTTDTVTAVQSAYAPYSSGYDPVPVLSVTYNDETLVQGADFRVIPQPGARTVTVRDSDKKPYRCSIIGIGNYSGQVFDIAYGVALGDISQCSIQVTPKTFNGELQAFSKGDVTVYDASGSPVDANEYTVRFPTDVANFSWDIKYSHPWARGTRETLAASTVRWYPGEYVEGASMAVNDRVDNAYPMIVGATNTSNYQGEMICAWNLISPVDLAKDFDVETVTLGGRVWYWDAVKGQLYQKDSHGDPITDESGDVVYGMEVTYTGEMIKPTVQAVYEADVSSPLYGRDIGDILIDATGKPSESLGSVGDYRYVYGLLGEVAETGRSADEKNTEASTDEFCASVCVRSNTGGDCSGYFVIPFSIEPADIAGCTVSAPDQLWTGSEITPVEITFNGMTLLEGRDYTIAYENNTDVGIASFTVAGIGNYTGGCSGTYLIVDADALSIAVDASTLVEAGEKSYVTTVSDADGRHVSFSEAGARVTVEVVGTAMRTVRARAIDASGTVISIEPTAAAQSNTLFAGAFTMPDSAVTVRLEYAVVFSVYEQAGKAPAVLRKDYTGAELLDATKRQQRDFYGYLYRDSSTGVWSVIGTDQAFRDHEILDVIEDWDAKHRDAKSKIVISADGVQTDVTRYFNSDTRYYFFGDYPSKLNIGTRKSQYLATLGFVTHSREVAPEERADVTLASVEAMALADTAATDICDIAPVFLCGMSDLEFKTLTNSTEERFVENVDSVTLAYRGDLGQASIKLDSSDKVVSVTDVQGVTLAEGEDYTIAYDLCANTVTIAAPEGSEHYTGSRTESVPSATIAGATRYDTAAQIAAAAYPDGAAEGVVACGGNFPDALSASALAGLVDGPILITTPTVLSDQAARAIDDLGIVRVTIVGGTSAVSTAVEQTLKATLGDENVVRIAGDTRYGTALAVYEASRDRTEPLGDTAIVARGYGKTGFADALSISPYANVSASPIFLAGQGGTLDVDSLAAIKGGAFRRVVIVGGTSVVSGEVEAALKAIFGTDGVIRIAGSNRYATSAAVARWIVDESGVGSCYERLSIATGRNFPDALSGGVLQGRRRSTLLLFDDEVAASEDVLLLLDDISPRITSVTFLGGSTAMPDSAKSAVRHALGWE